MMNEIPSRYNPKEAEDKWYKFWEENNYFAAYPDPAKKPFCIVIPPPNVTGILHMGHALNNTIQDILIRYHRMKDEASLWMPGTDHAGIATQNVVEKAIAKDGLRRQDLGREKFLGRVWQWKEEYGSTIIRQLKKLGASCDWQRARFTMDDEYSKAVIEAFVQLYKKGLIYQGDYIINWCPRCQTALSDEEAPHRDLQGNFYYIKYPLKEEITNKSRIPNPKLQNYIVVATTRPETMLGDTAVAVNPKDKRYKGLAGKTLVLPLVNREIKIISDSTVDIKFGTGAVKVTPAHDHNDYLLGKKHNLEFLNVMHPDGRMNENAGGYKGMDRFQAREVILEDLKEKGLLEKIEPHNLSAGHCYRCHTIIEPYLSRQWFVKMKPLAKPAIEAVRKGKIKFYPQRWTKVYLNWMENIQDWCISRQIWWGHRLPVYYCRDCQAGKSQIPISKSQIPNGQKKGVIVARTKVESCPVCGSGDIYQDEDVLDTWFSSWLWPFATFYWPFSSEQCAVNSAQRKDLGYFYPTSVLVTAPEIIFFWVARMIMAGLEFMKEIPFRDVYIHGTVRDIEGKKMSKSLGNIIDPLEIINEYGSDALRFSLISITAQGQDVYLSRERFEQGRNFANKIWNASRFILMHLEAAPINTDLCVLFAKENLEITERWILSRFYSLLKELNKMLEQYRFNEAANLLYAFFWHDFCDWYLEMIKPILAHSAQRTAHRSKTQIVMHKVLEKFLRLLHPFMPFVSEEVWQSLNKAGSQELGIRSIMAGPWPHLQEKMIDKKAEAGMAFIIEVITAIRNLRQELDVPLDSRIEAVIVTASKERIGLIESLRPQIESLSRLKSLAIGKEYRRIKSSISTLIKDVRLTIPLQGVIDVEKERLRIGQKAAKLKDDIRSKKNLLGNKEFLKKAPAEVVEEQKVKLKESQEALDRLKVIENELQ
jgi:valyl-tRNA synthetase